MNPRREPVGKDEVYQQAYNALLAEPDRFAAAIICGIEGFTPSEILGRHPALISNDTTAAQMMVVLRSMWEDLQDGKPQTISERALALIVNLWISDYVHRDVEQYLF